MPNDSFTVRLLKICLPNPILAWSLECSENFRERNFAESSCLLNFQPIISAQAKERQRCGQGGILLPQNSAEAKNETCEDLAKRKLALSESPILDCPFFGQTSCLLKIEEFPKRSRIDVDKS